jgi:hypothetical protein
MQRSNFYGGIVTPARTAFRSPDAPGAIVSPQRPGETPDRTDIEGQALSAAPPLAGPPLRPLTQYVTAQEIMDVFPAPSEEAEPAEFEQAPASFQEKRKAYPWQLPPVRPTSVFALDQGVSAEPPALPAAEAAALAEVSGVEG